MKKMIGFSIALVVFAIIINGVGAQAGWHYTTPIKSAKDLIRFLIPTPVATLDEQGHTERTRVLYNLVALKELAIAYDARIKVLEADKVATNAGLKALRADFDQAMMVPVGGEVVLSDPNNKE